MQEKVDYTQRIGMVYLRENVYNWETLQLYDRDCTVFNPFYTPPSTLPDDRNVERTCAYCNRSFVRLDGASQGDVALSHAALLVGSPIILNPAAAGAGSPVANTDADRGNGVNRLLHALRQIEGTPASGIFSKDGCKYRTNLGEAFPTAATVLHAMASRDKDDEGALPADGWDAMWHSCDKTGADVIRQLVPHRPACTRLSTHREREGLQTSVHLVGGQRRHTVDRPINPGPYRRKSAVEHVRWLTILDGELNVTLRPAPCTHSGSQCHPVTVAVGVGDVGA